jgi:hypothetical protein
MGLGDVSNLCGDGLGQQRLGLEQVALGIGVAAGSGLHRFAGIQWDSHCFTANNYTRSQRFRICFIGNLQLYKAD